MSKTKSLRTLAPLFLAALTATALAQTAPQTAVQTDAQKAFAAIKTLPGAWDGKTPEGRAVQVTFKTVSGGSAVMSEIMGHGPENMVSMIHMDGPNRLLLTHYCGAGNQPRMQASVSPDGKMFTFTFFDGTNIAPDAGHMQRMVLTLLDDNHHTEEWTFADHGKEMKEVFDLRRKM